jgi:CRP/FNR family cyclic AMP-dependent transcriptional regulator
MKMPFKKELRLLSMVDIFEPLSEDDIEELARMHRDIRLKPGETLFSPGEHGERLFILKEGRVQIYWVSAQGQEITLAMVDEGKVFGEMALTAQQLRVAYAKAVEPSIILSLRRKDLEDLILRQPKVGLRLIEWLSERVRQLQTRLEDVSSKEAPARLASLILQLVENEGIVTGEGYKIPTRYTHEQLGTMMSANRVTVTRAMAELRRRGAIEPNSRCVCIRDMEVLRYAAEGVLRAERIAKPEHKSG